MSDDLETVVRRALRDEATQLVPDGTVPPPMSAPTRRVRWASTRGRWLVPILSAATVLVLAVTTAMIVQRNRTTGTPAARGATVVEAPAAPIECSRMSAESPTELTPDDGMTEIAAAVPGIGDPNDPLIVGLRGTTFCLRFPAPNAGAGGSVELGEAPPGPLKYFFNAGYSNQWVTAGAVDASIDRIEYLPTGSGVPATVVTTFARLGDLRAFGVPVDEDGELRFYSGTTLRQSQAVLGTPPDIPIQTELPAPTGPPCSQAVDKVTISPVAAEPKAAPVTMSFDSDSSVGRTFLCFSVGGSRGGVTQGAEAGYPAGVLGWAQITDVGADSYVWGATTGIAVEIRVTYADGMTQSLPTDRMTPLSNGMVGFAVFRPSGSPAPVSLIAVDSTGREIGKPAIPADNESVPGTITYQTATPLAPTSSSPAGPTG